MPDAGSRELSPSAIGVGPVLGRLPWPLPALLAWGVSWGVFLFAGRAGWPAWASALAGVAAGTGLALTQAGAWRRSMVAAGFPLSALALAVSQGAPAWPWALALGALLALYPLRAWRDAPLFPTPAGALDVLPSVVGLPPAARVLDAGCGAGHGLRALRRAWPAARLEGVERSRLLAAWTALRCPWARVRTGDLWAGDWSGFDLVYLFQRPETMPRAWAKAQSEMRPGTWLVSLDFEVPGEHPAHAVMTTGNRPLWIYRIGGDNALASAQAGPVRADNPTGEGPPRPLKH